MLSKTTKLSTSIWINNNKEKVTVLKFWITVSLNVGFGREGQWDYESWLRALVHAQSHLPLPPNQDKKSVVVTALQGGVQGGTGHPHPELVAQLSVVSGWLSGVLLSTPNFGTKQIQALGGQPSAVWGSSSWEGKLTSLPKLDLPLHLIILLWACILSSLACPSLYDGNKNTINKRDVWLAHYLSIKATEKLSATANSD